MERASILENLIYGDNKPSITVLLNTISSKEIRITFRKGQEMKEHKSNYPIVVEVVDGKIDFGINGERHLLSKGELVALEPSILHNLIAEEDSIVRLSLNKSDDANRIKELVKH